MSTRALSTSTLTSAKSAPKSSNSWSDADERRLRELLRIEARFEARNKIATYFPDSGPLRRELYQKHLEFFTAGATHRERCFLAANKIGKTESAGGYETTCHLTGNYPQWWDGRRFAHPIQAWAAGDSGKTVKDIIQRVLLGEKGAYGTGLIPASTLINTVAKSGVADAVDTIYVRHASGGRSEITLKSYAEGRESFQGTNKHLIWLDEECAMQIYTECLLRTMTTNGLILATFTPLLGMSDLVRYFLDIKAEESE